MRKKFDDDEEDNSTKEQIELEMSVNVQRKKEGSVDVMSENLNIETPKKKRSASQDTGESSAKKQKKTAKSKYVPGGLSQLFGLDPILVEAVSEVEQPWQNASTVLSERKQVSTNSEDDKSAGKGSRNAQREHRRMKKSLSVEDKEKTIFIGNVEKSTTEKDVKRLFSQFGTIASVRMRGIIPAKPNISKKVAKLANKMSSEQKTVVFYVNFKEISSVEKALELNGQEHWGHRIRVDRCSGKRDLDSTKSIFLGNLPFDTTEDSLMQRMEKVVGPVVAVRLVRDPENGQSKGFAFVEFKNLASATLALSMPELKFKRRVLRVSKVLKRKKLRQLKSELKGQKPNMHQANRGTFGSQRSIDKKTFGDKQEHKAKLKKSVKKAIEKRKRKHSLMV